MTTEFFPVSVTHEGVSVYSRDRILTKLAAVNKRLAKLGAPAATVDFGPVVTLTERDEFTGFERSYDEFETVTVTGVEARHAGWHGVAVLDHTLDATEALVAKFPAEYDTEIPEAFRFGGSTCDHCGINVARNITILFRHDDGRWTRVGTTCVLEYIGIDPATVLWLAGAAFTGFDEDDEDGGGRAARMYAAPAEFLAAAAEATRINGFVPSGSTTGTPTKVSASDLVYGRIKPKDLEREFPGLDYAKGAEMAANVMAWVAESNDSSDFMTTARLACRASKAGDRAVGILAALPFCFIKATERKVAAAVSAAESAWIGEVGKKLAVTGTVTTKRTFENAYGMSLLVVVKLDSGEEVATFGSGKSLWDAEVGATVNFSGKVKAHEDKGYGKRTMLTLAKLALVAADGTVLPSPSSETSRNHSYGDHDAAARTDCFHCVTAGKETVTA